MSTKMIFYGELTKWPHQLFGYRASLFSATAWTQMWPNRMSDIIWIQTYRYSDGIPERTTFVKSNVEKYLHLKMLPALYICCINSSAFQPFFH